MTRTFVLLTIIAGIIVFLYGNSASGSSSNTLGSVIGSGGSEASGAKIDDSSLLRACNFNLGETWTCCACGGTQPACTTPTGGCLANVREELLLLTICLPFLLTDCCVFLNFSRLWQDAAFLQALSVGSVRSIPSTSSPNLLLHLTSESLPKVARGAKWIVARTSVSSTHQNALIALHASELVLQDVELA